MQTPIQQSSSTTQVSLVRRIFSVFLGIVITVTALIGILTLAAIVLARAMQQPELRARIRRFNKYRFNPLTLNIAGNRGGMYAAVKHVGRHSGHEYITPVVAHPLHDGFVIPLPYGKDVDWYRNVQATGHCTLLLDGQEYQLERPELLPAAEALPAYPVMQRVIFIGGGIKDYILIHKRKIAVEHVAH